MKVGNTFSCAIKKLLFSLTFATHIQIDVNYAKEITFNKNIIYMIYDNGNESTQIKNIKVFFQVFFQVFFKCFSSVFQVLL